MTEFECFVPEQAEFALFLEARNFENAVGFCEEQNATLARVSNQGEFEFVRQLVQNVDVTFFWLGIAILFGMTYLLHFLFQESFRVEIIMISLAIIQQDLTLLTSLKTSRFLKMPGSHRGMKLSPTTMITNKTAYFL